MRVFLSYRRTDSGGDAGRLYDVLENRFGSDQVFRDIDTIPPGVDFTKAVQAAVEACDVFLALIGPRWLSSEDEIGRRRLDRPDDFLRIELETALKRQIPIVPIFVQGSAMPRRDELPASIAELAHRNGFYLTDHRWHDDVEKLCEWIETPRDPSPAPPRPDPKPEQDLRRATRKPITVISADLVGSTGAGKRTDPEALQGALEKYYDAASAVLVNHGGHLDKTIGDAIVGVFGVPTAHEDDALRATRAAWELRLLASEFDGTPLADSDGRAQLRIAVATGEVLMQPDGRVVGDVIEVAENLRQHAEPQTVVLGDSTFQLVRSKGAEVLPVALHESGERSDNANAYVLTSLRDVGDIVDIVELPLAAPLVGRDRELRNLQGLLDDSVAENACYLVTILGDAGIGKSRLVWELKNRLEDTATVVVGRCPSYGQGIVFQPVAQVIRALADIQRSDDETRSRQKLAALTSRCHLPALVHVGLARLLGTEPPAGEVEESFWAFRSVLDSVAHERPLVVVFEDLHWADEGLLEVVEHVAERSSAAPLLIIATARETFIDQHRGWAGGQRRAASITLQPLDDDAARSLLDHLLDGGELPPNLARQLLDAADGVPLFVEEVLAALVQQGQLRRATGWTLTGTGDVVIPTTLSALLTARIDQLPPLERMLIQRAAVIGDVVAIEPLAALSDVDEASAAAVATSLVRRDIFRVEGNAFLPEGVRFRHALLREAAYFSLPKNERAVLHEAFVEWIDRTKPAASAEQEALVARHLELAITASREVGRVVPDGVLPRAARAFMATIDAAMGRGRASNELLLRARTIAEPDRAMCADLGPLIASALADNGDFQAAAELIARWTDNCENDVKWQLAELALLASRLSAGDAEGAGQIVDRLSAGPDRLEPADEIEMLIWRGFLATQNGRRAEAVSVFTRAKELARTNGLPHDELRALRHLVTSAVYGPTPAGAVETLLMDASVRMATLGTRPAAIARANALLAAMRGDADVARRTLGEYRELERDYGISRHIAGYGQDVYDIEWLAGDLDAARIALESSNEQLRLMNETNYRATVLASLARVLGRQDRPSEALHAADESERFTESYDFDTLVLLGSARAVAYARLGRFDEALEAGRVAVAVGSDCLYDLGEAWLSYAEAFARAGKPADARSATERALELFERKGVLAAATRARLVLAALKDNDGWPSDG